MSLTIKPDAVAYNRYVSTPPSKINLSIEALGKDGKTHFSLTAPGPIAYHDFDFGLHGVADKFPDQVIYHFPYRFPATLKLPGTAATVLADAAGKVWTEFVTNIRSSVQECRTNVIDTGTKAWDLLRLARHGKLTQIMPIQYTQVNQEFSELIQVLHTSKSNIIWLHRLKPVYEQDKKTDKFERAGFNDMGYEVDAILRMSYDDSKPGVEGFKARLGNCRPNRMLQGTEINGSDITFPKFATILYPSTIEENWK